MKNPYAPNTPEWQLFENYKGHKMSVLTQIDKVRDETEKLARITEAVERFSAALKKLDPAFTEEQHVQH